MKDRRTHTQQYVNKKLENIEKKLDHCLNVLNRGFNYQKEETYNVTGQHSTRDRGDEKDV